MATDKKTSDEINAGVLDGNELVRIVKDGVSVKTTTKGIADSGEQLCIFIPVGDETTAITTGTAKAKVINPYSRRFLVQNVVASLSTPQDSGSTFTVDVNDSGVSILSTPVTIDNDEDSSGTALAPPVINDTFIEPYSVISVDVDQVGDGTAKGLKVYVLGQTVNDEA